MKLIAYIIAFPVIIAFAVVAALYALIVLPTAALMGATERYV